MAEGFIGFYISNAESTKVCAALFSLSKSVGSFSCVCCRNTIAQLPSNGQK